MERQAKKFTDTGLKNLSPQATPYRDFGDGAATGLYIKVTEGAKRPVRSWLYRYNSPIHVVADGKRKGKAKERWMGLGEYPRVGIADAREAAGIARSKVKNGKDPIDERQQQREAERQEALKKVASAMTFKACVDRYLATHLGKYKNSKHRDQWRSTLRRATDTFGKLNVAEVDTAVIVKFLEPIWNTTPETGSRLRGRIEKVLDWAKVHSFREGENPARWKGHLEHALPPLPDSENMPAMQFAHIPDFMPELRAKEPMSSCALEFLILTVAPTLAVNGARWEEMDLKANTWTIPASRMKNRANKLGYHEIPLSTRAVDILENLPRVETGLVFPGKNDRPMSDNTLNKMLKDMHKARAEADLAPWKDKLTGKLAVVHGFRSTFRDWAGEETNFDKELIEFAMAHSIPDKSEAAYRRYRALEKRRRLMQAWDDYCAGTYVVAEVVPLRA